MQHPLELHPTSCSVAELADEQFGRDAWDLRILSCACVYDRPEGDDHTACYQAHVRLTLHRSNRAVVREAIAFGHGAARNPELALELAALAAEDSATRRTIDMLQALALNRDSDPMDHAPSPTSSEPRNFDKASPDSRSAILPVTVHASPAARLPIDKSLLTFPEVKRHRSKNHLAYVRTHPCLVCGHPQNTQAHHVRFAQPRALSRKVSDEYTVPLCGFHHYDLHRTGDERSWWKAHGIDPLKIARELWSQHVGDEPPAEMKGA